MTKNNNTAAIISEGCRFQGDLSLSGPLYINGLVEGNIRSVSSIVIGQSGRVQGDIHSTNIMINGSCTGNIFSNEVEILKNGLVTGEVHCQQCVITKGGKINGKLYFVKTSIKKAQK